MDQDQDKPTHTTGEMIFMWLVLVILTMGAWLLLRWIFTTPEGRRFGLIAGPICLVVLIIAMIVDSPYARERRAAEREANAPIITPIERPRSSMPQPSFQQGGTTTCYFGPDGRSGGCITTR